MLGALIAHRLSHLSSRRQSNHSLVDVLNLVQEGVHAWLSGSVVSRLLAQVPDQKWQLMIIQIGGACCVCPNQPADGTLSEG